MFKKLVSHLKFSPSLIGELADLANRLRVQNPVRIAGVVSLGLLLVIQAVLYLNPPVGSSPTHAGSIFFDSSIETNDVVNQVNNNYKALNDIFASVGISKENVERSSSVEELGSINNAYRLSRWPIDQNSVSINYNNDRSVYLTSVDNWGEVAALEVPFIVGNTNNNSQFIISSSTGSMFLTSLPNQSEQNSPITLSMDYINTSTQSKSAEPLKAGDRIKLTLHATNTSEESQPHTFRLPIGDSLEYLNFEQPQGENSPSLSEVSKELSWTPTEIPAQSTASREVTLKVKSSPSNLPQNPAHPYSQDCMATLIHGNQIDLPVSCTLQKELEMFTNSTETIPQGALLAWTGVAFFISLVLLAKALQEEEEVRIIRHKFNSGT